MATHEPQKYFVTRHAGAIQWVEESGVKVRNVEMEHFDVGMIGPGDIVMGTLPVHLAARVCERGGRYWHLAMEIPPERRGSELSALDMKSFGARLEEFRIDPLGGRISSTPDADAPAWPVGDRVLHVCVATGEAMANLLPMRYLPWDRVVIIATAAMQDSADHLQELVELVAAQRGNVAGRIAIRKFLPCVDPVPAVKAEARRIALELQNEFPGYAIELNWSGGLKPMSLALLEVFRPLARIFYCHTGQDRLEAISPEGLPQRDLPADLMDVESFLLGQGYRTTEMIHAEADIIAACNSRRALTATLSLNGEYFLMDASATKPVRLLSQLHLMGSQALPKFAARGAPGSPFSAFQQVDRLPDYLERASELLLAELVDAGMLSAWSLDRGVLKVEFASEAMARYLSGGYLEEFVLLTLSELGLPKSHFAVNVLIDVFRPLKGRGPAALNEIDAMVVWRNRLLVIECKAGIQLTQDGKSQDIVNKLAAVRKVAGPFGEAWLVSKRKLSEAGNADVLQRIGLHKLTLVSGRGDLLSLPQRLLEWCRISPPIPRTDWASWVLPFAPSRPNHKGRGNAKREPGTQSSPQRGERS